MGWLEGWEGALRAGRAESEAFAEAVRDPERTQRRFLLDLIGRNAATEFGREHSFGRIETWSDYQARVPIRDYDAFAPYVARILAGEPAVLAADPIEFIERTGGSSGGSKSIPFTRGAIDGFAAALMPWMNDLIARRPGVAAGRAYFALSPAGRTGREMAGAIRLGSPHNFTFFADAEPHLDRISVVPMTIRRLTDLAEWQFLTNLHLLAAADLSLVWVWSPTYLTTLVAAMRRDAERLVRALAEGLDHPAPGEGGGRFRLAADPARAKEVAGAFTAATIDTARLWPRLDTISCWMDATSTGFAAELKRLFPSTHFQPKGLLSTEAAVSFPYSEGEGSILAIRSAFFEFIGADGRPRPCWEVREGERYRVVLSTRSGLYRYDTGDLVDVVGFSGPTPRLRFVGRAMSSDLCGEKLTDEFVSRCLLTLPLRPGQCAFLTPQLGSPARYRLYVDDQPGTDWEGLRRTLEARLGGNPQYAYARAIGQLAELDVRPVADLFARYAGFVLGRGRSISGLKVPALAVGLGEAWEASLTPINAPPAVSSR